MRTQKSRRDVLRLIPNHVTSTVAVGFVLVMAAMPSLVRGEDARPELPKDGAWIRYQAEFENRDKQRKLSMNVTLSFVGTVMEDGKPCRWVEIKNIPQARLQPGQSAVVSKLLIPESALLDSECAPEHALRVWMQKGDGSVVKLPPIEPARARAFGLTYERFFLWSPGSRKTQTRIDESKDIEYQNGRLKGAQSWVRNTVADVGPNRDVKWDSTYTVWQHPDLPVGTAEIRLREEISRDGKVETTQSWVYRVEDAGTDAKGDLPDRQ